MEPHRPHQRPLSPEDIERLRNLRPEDVERIRRLPQSEIDRLRRLRPHHKEPERRELCPPPPPGNAPVINAAFPTRPNYFPGTYEASNEGFPSIGSKGFLLPCMKSVLGNNLR